MDIRFEEVSYWYGKGTPFATRALDRVSLTIPGGQFVALMGETGSGKTTLAQMINGLLRPSEGTVYVGNYKLTSKKQDLRSLRKRIGYLFQYPEHQLFEETVAKDIAFGLRQQGIPEALVPQRDRQVMDRVGLDYDQFKDRSPLKLSGGQMRRVALAGILAYLPEILILDEPTAGLDPLSRKEILDLVKRLQAEDRITVILITHRLEEALEYAERILIMKEGKLALDLPPNEAFRQRETLKELGIIPTPLMRFWELLQERIPEPPPTLQEEGIRHYLARLARGGT